MRSPEPSRSLPQDDIGDRALLHACTSGLAERLREFSHGLDDLFAHVREEYILSLPSLLIPENGSLGGEGVHDKAIRCDVGHLALASADRVLWCAVFPQHITGYPLEDVLNAMNQRARWRQSREYLDIALIIGSQIMDQWHIRAAAHVAYALAHRLSLVLITVPPYPTITARLDMSIGSLARLHSAQDRDEGYVTMQEETGLPLGIEFTRIPVGLTVITFTDVVSSTTPCAWDCVIEGG